MCNVCVADAALKSRFARPDIGYEVRAEGAREFGLARYQIRRIGHPWPRGWVVTCDLAGSLGTLGFDLGFSLINRRRFKLLSEIAKSLERGDLHSVYPALAYVHERMIWPSRLLTKLHQVLRWVRDLGRAPGCASATSASEAEGARRP